MHSHVFKTLLTTLLFTLTSAGYAETGRPFQAHPGAIKGQFEVSPTGAATYSMPIELPNGLGGLTPQLGLTYNSDAENGLLGRGWSITGLSMISRCAATKQIDGYYEAPDFRDDKLCLDGQRLIEISPSKEYRLANNPATKVIADGSYAGVPINIVVLSSDGLSRKYKPTWKRSDSPFHDEPSFLAPFIWHLDTVQDQHGNQITFNYERDEKRRDLAGEKILTKYISTIVYKNHSDAEVMVKFDWGQPGWSQYSRHDKISGWQAGEHVEVTRTLKQIIIQTSFSADRVNKNRYVFQYHGAGATLLGQAMLKSITNCSMEDQLPEGYYSNIVSDWFGFTYGMERNDFGCLPPTEFDWGGMGEDFAPKYIESEQWAAPSDLSKLDDPSHPWSQMVDLNGDGLPDWVQGRKGHLQSWINNGEQFVESTNYAPPVPMYDGKNILAQFVDVNSDGYIDLVAKHPSAQNVSNIHINTGSGWAHPRYINRLPVENFVGKHIVGNFVDLNQDGYVDFVYSRQGHACEAFLNRAKERDGNPYWRESSDDLPCKNDQQSLRYSSGAERGALVDVNADSRVDWVVVFENFGKTYLNTKDGWKESRRYQMNQPGYGEGIGFALERFDDGLIHATSWNAVYRNIGSGFKYFSGVTLGARDARLPSVYGDFNNDGTLDQAVYGRSIGLWTRTSPGRSIEDVMPPNWQAIPGTVAIGDLNADGLTDYIYTKKIYDKEGKSTTIRKTYLGAGVKTTRIKAITDGLGNRIEIDYHVLSDTKSNQSVYSPGSRNSGKGIPTLSARHVVSEHRSLSDGLAHSIRYRYGDLRADIGGHGNLGFRWSEVINTGTGVTKRSVFSHQYPFIGRVEKSYSYLPNKLSNDTHSNVSSNGCPTGFVGGILSCSEVGYAYITPLDKVKLVYQQSSKTLGYNQHGQHLKTTTTEKSNLDEYGNVGSVAVTTADTNSGEQWTKINTNTYENYPEDWHLGRLKRSEVRHIDSLGNTTTKTAEFEYDPVTRQLSAETTEPDHIGTPLYLRKDYTYDQWGNKDTVSTKGYDYDGSELPERSAQTQTEYVTSENGKPLRKVTVTNALGHTEVKYYELSRGNLVSQTGPNGITTRFAYDAFGRKTHEYRADGTYSQITRRWANSADPQRTAYVIETQTGLVGPIAGYPDVIPGGKQYFDAKGRKTRVATTAIDGREIYEDTVYNALGQVSKTSRKYFAGDPIYWASFEYDSLGRAIQTNHPDGRTTRLDYNGFTTTTYDAKGNSSSKTKNAAGKVVKVVDAAGGELRHYYDVTGALDYSIDPQGNRIDIDYDIHGRKLGMRDPAMGNWLYKYNSFGELRWQKNAKGQITTINYDKLGRMFWRRDNGQVNRWYYDRLPGETLSNAKSNRSIGKLVKVTDQLGYSQENQFDQFGRAIATITTIQGQEYLNTVEYDPYSRVAKTFKPGTLNGADDVPFELENLYNEFGHLTSIRSPIDQSDDYDLGHLAEIMMNVLDAAKAAEQEANQLMQDALAYQQQAKQYEAQAEAAKNNADNEAEKQALRDQITELKAHAQQMRAAAETLKGYAAAYQAKADYYQQKANVFHQYAERYARYNSYWWGRWLEYIYNYWAEREQRNANYNVAQAQYNLNQAQQTQTAANQAEAEAAALQAQLDNWVDPNDTKDYAALAEEQLANAENALVRAEELREEQQNHEAHAEMLQQSIQDDGYATWWRADQVDAEGRISRSMTGNGLLTLRDYNPANGSLDYIHVGAGNYTTVQSLAYEYDANNNVDRHVDDYLGATASYTYDILDRIKTYDYQHENDNDSDSWDYNAVRDITRSDKNGTYQYGTANHGRHALLSTNNHSNIRYDQNGHITNKSDTNFTWTSFGKPSRISNGKVTNEFTYGPSRSRYYQKEINTGVANTADKNYQQESSYQPINSPYTRETLYIGGGYEKVTTSRASGTTVQHKYTLSVGGAAIGIYTRVQAVDSAPSTNYTRYFHKDALGSITAITDQHGKTIDRYRYRPFGEQIAVGGDYKPPEAALGLALTHRGYTGHEHLRGLNLIHMNGRVYDPTLGRFMSADPNIQAPNNGQNYNRYAYVLNNPLKYTDPSGYFFRKIFKFLDNTSIVFNQTTRLLRKYKWARAVHSAVMTFFFGMFGQPQLGAALSSAHTTYAMGGDDAAIMKSFMTTALLATATSGVGDKYDYLNKGNEAWTAAWVRVELGRAITHGMLQGLGSVAQGGKFGDAALSGFVGSMAGHVGIPDSLKKMGDTPTGIAARTAYVAAIGGTASALSGGSFSNGARTAAFVHLFNAEQGSFQKLWDGVKKWYAKIDTMYDVDGRLGIYGAATVKRAGVAKLSLQVDGTSVWIGERPKITQGVGIAAEIFGAEILADSWARESTTGGTSYGKWGNNPKVFGFAGPAHAKPPVFELELGFLLGFKLRIGQGVGE